PCFSGKSRHIRRVSSSPVTAARAGVPPAEPEAPSPLRRFFGVFRYSRSALELVWSTNRSLTLAFAPLTLVAGVLPAAVAYVGQLIFDGVVAAIEQSAGTGERDYGGVLLFVGLEA